MMKRIYFFFSIFSILSGVMFSNNSILSISADIETIGEILKKIIPTLEEVCHNVCFFLEVKDEHMKQDGSRFATP